MRKTNPRLPVLSFMGLRGNQMLLIPKNWTSFQHYKDRAPPWIKLHKGLLDDSAFQRLPVASRALAPMLWLLASEEKDGAFCGDAAELAFRLRQSEKEITSALKPLIDNGFFILVRDASKSLADCVQLAVPETEESRVETETKAESGFASFWSAYPKKKAKDDAKKAFDKRKPDKALLDLMLSAIAAQSKSDDWLKDGGKFIPYPATWLDDGRWQDEATAISKPKPGPDPMQAVFAERDRKAAPIPQAIREKIATLTNMVKQ